MDEWRLLLGWLHALGAAVLLGARLAMAWYLDGAARSGDALRLAAVAHQTLRGEGWLILPAVVVQFLTGAALASAAGLAWSIPWLAASLGLFTAVGVVWLPLLWLEYRIAALAMDGGAAPQLRSALRRWRVLEGSVVVAVLALYALMIVRPDGFPS